MYRVESQLCRVADKVLIDHFIEIFDGAPFKSKNDKNKYQTPSCAGLVEFGEFLEFPFECSIIRQSFSACPTEKKTIHKL